VLHQGDNCAFSAAVGFGLACQRPWTSLQLLPRTTATTGELRLAMSADKPTELAIITLKEH